MQNIKQRKTILILNMGTIGDILMSTPIAQCLKCANDNTHISWLIQPEFAEIIEDNPYIDKIIKWDYNTFKKNLSRLRLLKAGGQIASLNKLLTPKNFDLCLDLQGVKSTGLISIISRATHRLALEGEEGNNWFTTKNISRTLGDRIQIGSEYRYLINQLGISDKNWKMHIPENTTTKMGAAKLTQKHIGYDPYIVICPFSNSTSKHWKNAYWQQIILRIRGRYQLRTIILGKNTEHSEAQEICKLSGAINLTGKTTILEAAEVIRNATLAIGIDTSLTHMAHAVNTPTISLFGPTFPYAYAGTDNSNVIHSDRYCSPCNLNDTFKKQYHCMKEITPDKVLTEIKPIVQQSKNYHLAI